MADTPAIDPNVAAATGVQISPASNAPSTPNTTDLKPSTSGHEGGKSNLERFSASQALGLSKKPSEHLKDMRKELDSRTSGSDNPFRKEEDKEADSTSSTASREVLPASKASSATGDIPQRKSEHDVNGKPLPGRKPRTKNPDGTFAKEEKTDDPGAVAPNEPVDSSAPASSAPVEKIKLAGKEYTPSELEAHLKALEEKANPQAVKPKDDLPPLEEKETTEQPETPEQREAKAKQFRALEEKFISDHANSVDLGKTGVPLSTEDWDTILEGGEKAVEKFNDIRRRDQIHAVLMARKTVAQDINPLIESVRSQFAEMAPLMEQHRMIQAYESESRLFTAAPDLKPHVKIVRTVAQALQSTYPQWVAKLTPEQWQQAVSDQARNVIKEFNLQAPQTEQQAQAQSDAVSETINPGAAPQAQSTLPPAVTSNPPAQTPAKVALPVVKPPGANAPGVAGPSGAPKGKSYASTVLGL